MKFPTGIALAIALLALPVVQSHEPVMTLPDPGFRPESVLESRFLEEIDSATIAVYPTIVRKIDRTAQSFTSQAQVVTFLNEHMIGKATMVAMLVSRDQIARAQYCASLDKDQPPIRLPSDFIDGFETGLVSGSGADDIPLGFSTFHGERSRARMSTTAEHPPVPGEAPGNSVLKLDLDVKTWAGVLHRFENESADHWIGYDVSDAQELSFWLHGNNSGTTLVIDVLDNRRPCPHMDDAERYSYQFIDDFAGWQLISIPFEVMLRKEIGNGAPDDGLGLSAVHGWALAALNTKGEATFFIDDVRLRRVPLLDSVPEGLSRETDIWVPINELPMFGGHEKTASQIKADKEFLQIVLPGFKGDRRAAAEHFARTGWNLYYSDDWSGAIKRFNQAWLLHPDNQHALWGFAVISRERGKMETALKFYRMALEGGSSTPALVAEYEQLRGLLGE